MTESNVWNHFHASRAAAGRYALSPATRSLIDDPKERFTDHLRHRGPNGVQERILAHIDRYGPSSVNELENALGRPKTTISTALQRLRIAGEVEAGERQPGSKAARWRRRE